MNDEFQKPTPLVANPFANSAVATREASNAVMESAIAREVATVQAKMLIAQRFPRNPKEACDKMLLDFTRPELCEGAMYEYSKGGTDASGLSIRAAEVMANRWGHIHMGVEEVEQRDGYSTMRAFAFDAQSGVEDSRTFQVKHWRDTKGGGYAIRDQRDIYELTANLAARRKRAAILTIIPRDVQESCEKQIIATLTAKVNITPEYLATIEATFASHKVSRAAIERMIQRKLEAITPGQVVRLRNIATALKDGMGSPADYFDLDEPTNGAEGTAPTKPAKGAAGLKEAAAKAAAPKPTPTDAAAAGEPAKAPGDMFGGTQDGGPDLSREAMLGYIAKATTVERLDEIADLIPKMTDEIEQSEVTVELKVKRKQFNKGAK